jgi:sugar/nucleoside kinase (ribokinase family)
LIVTLTINPAIDRIVSIDRLAFEDRAYINSSRESAGGRGINVSSVIHSFGGETLAVLISGGDSGKRLEGLLGKCGYRIAVVPVQNEIRTNLTITDKHGLTVNLNEPGPQLGKAEVARVERVVRDRLDNASWLAICGSIPPGVPPAFYGKLISMARQKKVKTLLHADGEALREGIAARPTVVSPNQQEAGRLLGRTDSAVGSGVGGAHIGQPGRGGRFCGRPDRGAGAAHRRGVPDRRGGCADGGLRLGAGAENECGGRAALGGGRGNRRGPPAGHELRQPGAGPGNLPPGGSAASGIGPGDACYTSIRNAFRPEVGDSSAGNR